MAVSFIPPVIRNPWSVFDALAAFAARFFAAAEATDEVHRHVLTNLVVEAVDESALTVHGYLQIVATARGGDSRLVRMTTVTDHVVRVGEEWKIARRTVSRDDAPRASEQA